tara:strand:- start:56 stop:424 length:369 start_codon:yes stop_codon:yes gene_type:complete
MSSLREFLDDLLPSASPAEVRAKAKKYGQENPDKSDAEVAELFAPSLKRAERKQAEKALKRGKKTAEAKRKMTKAEMAYGGMANGKKHMYSGGGAVTDNAGLRALKASGPKGMEAYKNITGK